MQNFHEWVRCIHLIHSSKHYQFSRGKKGSMKNIFRKCLSSESIRSECHFIPCYFQIYKLNTLECVLRFFPLTVLCFLLCRESDSQSFQFKILHPFPLFMVILNGYLFALPVEHELFKPFLIFQISLAH